MKGVTAKEYLFISRTIIEPVSVQRAAHHDRTVQHRVTDPVTHQSTTRTDIVSYAFRVFRRDGERGVAVRIEEHAARVHRGRVASDTIEETAEQMARAEAVHLLVEDYLKLERANQAAKTATEASNAGD